MSCMAAVSGIFHMSTINGTTTKSLFSDETMFSLIYYGCSLYHIRPVTTLQIAIAHHTNVITQRIPFEVYSMCQMNQIIVDTGTTQGSDCSYNSASKVL